MKQRIAHITLIVDDYDEEIKFYTEKLNFTLVEDSILSETKRWVLITPAGSAQCCLLLAKAVNDEQKSRIGNQTGGRVFLFLYTDDFSTEIIKTCRRRESNLLGNLLLKSGEQ
jgi:catechol 2,3-dioxygenase-like lactoylglutathione lyase family enzyme